MIAVVIHSLLAEQHQIGLFFFDYLGEELGDGEGFERCVGFEQNAAMRAHGQGRQNDVVAGFGADGHHDDFAGLTGFGQLHGGLDCMLAEGVHRHAHARCLDARAIWADTNAHVVIDHALHRDENFHKQLRQVGASIAKRGSADKARRGNIGSIALNLLERSTVQQVP